MNNSYMDFYKYLVIFFLALPSIYSCNSWNKSSAVTLKEACISQTNSWISDTSKANAYCNCIITEIKTKYQNYDDALLHVSELAMDSALLKCREMH